VYVYKTDKTSPLQEEVGIGEDGVEETVSLLQPNSSCGEISILCNIPQPYTVRVCELCRLLRLDKQSFTNVLDIYFYDGRKILNNLLEVINFVMSMLLLEFLMLMSVEVEYIIEYRNIFEASFKISSNPLFFFTFFLF
jgi:CRP-like cAMP-binding protein